MHAVVPGIGVFLIKPGDGAKAGDEFLTKFLVCAHGFLLTAGPPNFACSASARRPARRETQVEHRHSGALLRPLVMTSTIMAFASSSVPYSSDNVPAPSGRAAF